MEFGNYLQRRTNPIFKTIGLPLKLTKAGAHQSNLMLVEGKIMFSCRTLWLKMIK